MWTDAEVVRYIGGTPSSRSQVWTRILAYAGHWMLLGYGYWAVESKATDAYIGELGFADFRRDISPSLVGLPELGWALMPAASGHGHATEALRAVVAWGDANLGTSRTACIVHPENLASRRVATKLGFAQTAATTFNDGPTLVFQRTSAGGGDDR